MCAADVGLVHAACKVRFIPSSGAEMQSKMLCDENETENVAFSRTAGFISRYFISDICGQNHAEGNPTAGRTKLAS